MNRFLTHNIFVSLLLLASIVNLSCALLSPFSGQAYHFLHWFCHQQSDRCFNLLGYQLGVCARCTGIYIGIIFGFPLLGFRTPMARWILVCASLIAVTFTIIKFTGHDVPNPTRSISGACMGIVALYLVSTVSERFLHFFSVSLFFIAKTLHVRGDANEMSHNPGNQRHLGGHPSPES